MTTKNLNNKIHEESSENYASHQTQKLLFELENYKKVIKPSLTDLIIEEIKLSDKMTYYFNLWILKQDEYRESPAEKKKILEANNEILKKYGKAWISNDSDAWENGNFVGQLQMIRWVLTGRRDNLGDEDNELISNLRKKIKISV